MVKAPQSGHFFGGWSFCRAHVSDNLHKRLLKEVRIVLTGLVADIWWKDVWDFHAHPQTSLGLQYCMGNEGQQAKSLCPRLGLEFSDILYQNSVTNLLTCGILKWHCYCSSNPNGNASIILHDITKNAANIIGKRLRTLKRSGPLNRLNAILSLLHPLDRYRTPSARGNAIGRPLSRPISHPNTGGSPQPSRSKPLGGLNRAIVAL